MVPWKRSATVIALVRNALNRPNNFNYDIIFQKRSSKSAFYPNAVVFPGGAYEDCDSSEDWLNYFKSFGISHSNFNKFQNPNTPIPLILEENGDIIKNHVGLRITAIRETFEEMGILMCKTRKGNVESSSICASYINNFDIPTWQKKVHDDPLQFLKLCQTLDCYPDIFSLYLWSNWLTPVRKNSKRYNTLFFLTAFENRPEVHFEKNEVSEYQWSNPKEIINSFENRDLLLAPPQWYELTRLCHQKDFDTLMNFAKARSPTGAELYFPIYQKTNNGHVVLLPGDELYPDIPDLVNEVQIVPDGKTIEEVNSSSKVLHRMIRRKENYDMIGFELKNHIISCNHLSPLSEKIPQIKNKL